MTGIMAVIASAKPGLTYANGLYQRQYSAYFGNSNAGPPGTDNVNYFDSASPAASAVDLSPISLSVGTTVSYQFLGYWLATSETIYFGSTYFQLTSDDASYLWVGSTALTGYTYNNALINNGGTHSAGLVQGSYPMTAGVYYPLRIQYGNFTGSGSLSLAVYNISTALYTTTVSSNIFYNAQTNGF